MIESEIDASIIIKLTMDAKTFDMQATVMDVVAKSTTAQPVTQKLQPCPGVEVRGSAGLHFEINNLAYEGGCMDNEVIGMLFSEHP